LLAGAWIIVTAMLARHELGLVRDEVRQLRSQIDNRDFAGASATAKAMATHAHRAHRYTTGPAWAVAAHVPLGGAPLKTARGIAAGADTLGRSALPTLISARDTLDPADLRSADGTVDVARIAAIAPSIARADATVSSVTARLQRLPRRSWVSGIDRARRDVVEQLLGIAKTVRSADIAAQALPDLLGGNGVRRYFVTFQNDAEARGTGGLPGAFGIAEANHGKLRFVRFYNDNTLDNVSADVDFGKDYDQLYLGTKSTSLYVNSNLSSHFPYAAQIWLSMWAKHTGQKLDGAVALDPTALSYLLRVTGPAALPDGTSITADNVVALTQSTAYVTYPDRDKRRVFLRTVAATVGDHVVASRADLHDIVDAAGQASDERRLLVWSRVPSIEALIEQTSVSGSIPDTSTAFVGLSIVNDGGNKLDYYLDRSVVWQADGCSADRNVTVTITLTNDAPATGLPDAVVSRSDRHDYPIKRGDNRLDVSYYGTSNGALVSAEIDGKQVGAEIGAEREHPVYRLDLELPRGTSRTVTLKLREPTTPGTPIVLRQPLVRPLNVTVEAPRC